MDRNSKNISKKYDRVMPRVHNRSGSSVKSSSLVMRHNTPSSVCVGAKPSVSNASSSVFSELPTILNDYCPEIHNKPVKRTFVVKPRRTLKSLDPALSPPRPASRPAPRRPRDSIKKSPHIRAEDSAPSVMTRERDKWFESHVKQCYSSRSHSKLKELKDEIQAYHDTEKLMKLRSRLYRSCGVTLDDDGQPTTDKAVQVEHMDHEKQIENGKEITKRFHGPDHEYQERWIKFVRKDRNDDKWLPSKHTVICSVHFKDDDKYTTQQGRKYLKKCAVPEIRPGVVEIKSEPVSDSESTTETPRERFLSRKLVRLTAARNKLAANYKKVQNQNRYLTKKCELYKQLLKKIENKVGFSLSHCE